MSITAVPRTPAGMADRTLEVALDGRVAGAKVRAKGSGNDVGTKFEAFVLQTFVQEMLPKSTSMTFGKGFAGEAWRSLLAEKLATEIAHGGGIGISKVVDNAPQVKAATLAAERKAQAAEVMTAGASDVQPRLPPVATRSSDPHFEWTTEVTGVGEADATTLKTVIGS